MFSDISCPLSGIVDRVKKQYELFVFVNTLERARDLLESPTKGPD
jgi:hypothetical protein